MIILVIVTGAVIVYQGKQDWKYNTIFTLFFLSMTGAIMSSHLGLTWVFVEATTLTSAYLIMQHKTQNSLEATWKYVFLCSIGISLAFVGIILLLIGCDGVNSLAYTDLYTHADKINPFWLKLSFKSTQTGCLKLSYFNAYFNSRKSFGHKKNNKAVLSGVTEEISVQKSSHIDNCSLHVVQPVVST